MGRRRQLGGPAPADQRAGADRDVGSAPDHDAAALRIAHRVGNQIEQDALQQEAIAAHPGVAGQDAQTPPIAYYL